MSRATILSAALIAAACALVGRARADGLVARAADLPDADRASLQAEVAADRAAHPEAFARLRGLRGYRPEVYRNFRKHAPDVSIELRRLGPTMLLPMLEALVLRAPDLHGANDAERRAVIAGMLEQVGRLRDARAAGALGAIWSKGEPAWIDHLAGAAIGRLCRAVSEDASLGRLRAGLDQDKRRGAAVFGLGQCRTMAGARLLADQLDQAADPDDAASLASALGALGSSWAWAALGPDHEAEALDVREVAAAALVRGFVRFDGPARAIHERALLRVDHPETRRIAASNAGGADAATQGALQAVADAIEARRR